MSELQKMLRDGAEISAIGTFLNGCDHGQRRQAVEALNGSDLGKLYSAAHGQHIDLAFLVPEGLGVGQEVVHHGKNSLPLFGGTFRKRFVRIDGDQPLLGGFNDNDGIVASVGWATGPGYFVVRPRGCDFPDGRTDTDQLFINYYEVPDTKPALAHWPEIADNNGLVSWLVFGDMCDYMWRVSDHVSIGEAWKRGKSMGQYFALVREDPA